MDPGSLGVQVRRFLRTSQKIGDWKILQTYFYAVTEVIIVGIATAFLLRRIMRWKIFV